MSHEYELAISVRGVQAQDDDRVYDEVAKYWNAAECGRRIKVICIKGIDRISGVRSPVTMRRELEPHLEKMLGYPVKVAIKGTDREGINRGNKFWLRPDNDGHEVDPFDCKTWGKKGDQGHQYSEDPHWWGNGSA